MAAATTSSNGAVEDVPVLVVGGSLTGLTVALLLAWHGIDSLTVERHPGTAVRPRAGHLHLRTTEILRSVGLEPAVRARSEEQYVPNGGINNVESLAGREIASYFSNLNAGVEELSPTVRLFIDQDALEPILRSRAEELGARIRFGTECVSLAEDELGVTAQLVERTSGSSSTVRAAYVVAADGARSALREHLGIAMSGHGLLSSSVTIYFRSGADLEPLLRGRTQGVSYVTSPVLRGFFRLRRDGNGGFLVVNLIGDTARPEVVAAYPEAPWANVADGMTEERARALVQAAIGVPGIPVVVEDVASWQAVADVAERYGSARVLLAGDAAHVVPPNGGFGGNTGVQDAHNLAWKLAFVLGGHAGPGLVASYDAERRPIGELTVEQAYARYVARVAPYLAVDGMPPLVDDLSMELGYRYRSTAVIEEPGGDGALVGHPGSSAAVPGSRAPHVALRRGAEEISTLDLLGRDFVLLAGPDAGAWCAAAEEVARDLGLTVTVHRVGEGGADPHGRFPGSYGISSSGAVLVRPDGFVGWRSHAGPAPGEGGAILEEALATLLSRREAEGTRRRSDGTGASGRRHRLARPA